jgi:altronate dehydratase
VVRVAGGEQSKSEELDMGDNAFVPWQTGAVT